MPYAFSTRFPYVKKKCSRTGTDFTQKVIVPQGLINPTKTTVIEIPDTLRSLPTIVAKAKQETYDEFCPLLCSTFRDDTRYVFPKDSNASASLGSSQYSFSKSSPSIPARSREQEFEEARGRSAIEDDNESVRSKQLQTSRPIAFAASKRDRPYIAQKQTTSMQDLYGPYTSVLAASPDYDISSSALNSSAAAAKKYAKCLTHCTMADANSSHQTLKLHDKGMVISRRNNTEVPFNEEQGGDPSLVVMLDEIEEKELSLMQNNLRRVQLARRKMIYDMSQIKT